MRGYPCQALENLQVKPYCNSWPQTLRGTSRAVLEAQKGSPLSFQGVEILTENVQILRSVLMKTFLTRLTACTAKEVGEGTIIQHMKHWMPTRSFGSAVPANSVTCATHTHTHTRTHAQERCAHAPFVRETREAGECPHTLQDMSVAHDAAGCGSGGRAKKSQVFRSGATG